MCIYVRTCTLSFRVLADICVISNENLLIQKKTLVFRQNLEFRSKYLVFQIHNFGIPGFSHI